MKPFLHRSMSWSCLFVLAGMIALPAGAQERASVSDVPAPGVVRSELPLEQSDGAPIARVFVDLLGGSGDAARDQATRASIDALLEQRIGLSVNAAELRALPAELAQIRDVSAPAVAVYGAAEPGTVVVLVKATLSEQADTASPKSDLTLIASGPHGVLRWRLSGGIGVFSDYNPWFGTPGSFTAGSPVALDPPGRGSTHWAEGSVEFGLAGAVRLGELPATVFGEATGLSSGATGHDLFRSDTRFRTATEKAYAGLAWVGSSRERYLRLSAGRQNWQLYGGFLFSRFAAGSNAGPSPGLYQSPRTTYEQARLLDVGWDHWRLEAFDVDPSELEGFDSGSRYVGMNLRYTRPDSWELGLTRFHVPQSRANLALASGGRVPRQGVQVFAARAGWSRVAGIDGLDLLGEYAWQDHRHRPWDASAWYAQIRYTAVQAPWTPSVTYRRAVYSGDHPETIAQEAFDAPLASGLDEWVQGVGFKKVVTNSNLRTHRIRVNFGPRPQLNYTVDVFRLDADVPTISGARHYGDELNVTLRWALTPRLFLLGVTGVAWPGAIMRERTNGAARPWTTLQASLFWGF